MFAGGGHGDNLTIAAVGHGGLQRGRGRMAGPCREILSDWNVFTLVGVLSLGPAVVAYSLGGERVLALEKS